MQLCGSWWLAKREGSHATNFHDLTNFFGSVSQERVGETDRELFAERDWAYGRCFSSVVVFEVEVADGLLRQTTTQGVLRGNQSALVKVVRKMARGVIGPFMEHVRIMSCTSKFFGGKMCNRQGLFKLRGHWICRRRRS